ncbi:hypothetical protein D3C75_909000 [compost metagenome]
MPVQFRIVSGRDIVGLDRSRAGPAVDFYLRTGSRKGIGAIRSVAAVVMDIELIGAVNLLADRSSLGTIRICVIMIQISVKLTLISVLLVSVPGMERPSIRSRSEQMGVLIKRILVPGQHDPDFIGLWNADSRGILIGVLVVA